MSHEPPVPPGNTSPYPVQEPPHAHAAEPDMAPPSVAVAPASVAGEQRAPATLPADATPVAPASAPAPAAPPRRRIPGGVIVTGVLGVGAVVAGVTALLFGNKDATPPRPRRRK